MQSDASLRLSKASKECAAKLFATYPLTNKERQELLPPSDKERSPYATGDGKQQNHQFEIVSELIPIFVLFIGRDLSRNMGKVNSGIPQVPARGLISPHSGDSAGEEFASIKRQELPIWAQRQEIIDAISQNQVNRIEMNLLNVLHPHETHFS